MDLHLAGSIMVVPTVSMAVHVAWRSRHDLGELLHSLAVVFWILANSVRMIGELYLSDGTRPLAATLFVAGLFCVTWSYAVELPRLRIRARTQGH